MDDNQFDDVYETRRTTYRDHSADMQDFVQVDASTPAEVKDSHYDEAKEKFPELAGYTKENAETAKNLLDLKNAPHTVEDEAEQRAIHEAARREGIKNASTDALDAAIPDATKAAGPDAFAASGGGTPGAPTGPADSGTTHPAEKPTSLESTLANIRMNGQRQSRLVISGDPAIEKAFYAKLEERGQVYYKGGAPVITLSTAKAIKVLKETVAEFEGAKATHAMALELDRDHGGIVGTVNSKLANMPAALARKVEGDGSSSIRNLAADAINSFSRRHAIDVVVIGQPAVVEAKMKELGSLAQDMERNGHVKEGSVTVVDGKLKLAEDKPLELNGTARLTDVLRVVNYKVDTYNNEQSEIQKAANELKRADDAKKVEKHRNEVADEASGKEKPERPNQHAQKLVDRIEKGIDNPDLLSTKNGKGQVEAVALLQQSRGLKDPADRELQTLPEATRHKAIVHMAALVEKVANKEYGADQVKALDSHKADTSSIRQKVDEYIAMEAKRDSSFAEKAQPLLKDLVDRKVLTEQQVEAISEKVTAAVAKEASTEARAEKSSGAEKAAGPEAAAGEARASSDAKPDTDKAAATEAAAADTRTTAEAKSAAAPAAESKAPATDSIASLDANAAAPVAGAKDVRAEPTLGPDMPVSSAPKDASEAPAPAADKPLELRDRLEALAKEGPAALTADKAHALVAELDGIRSKPLASLDGGSGTEPTRTLVRVETLLKELESGRFGEELKAQAKDLAEPLQKWEKQDVTRFNNDGSVTTLSRDDVAAGVKTGLSKWDRTEPSAQADVAAPSSAPTKGSAGDAASTTAAPEKAPASATSTVAQDAPVTKADAPAEVKAEATPAAKVEAPAAKADAAPTSVPEVAQVAKADAVQPAKAEAAVDTKPAPVLDPAATAAKEQAAQRLSETESAGAKLSLLMANPAGSFTNRDKTWNHEAVQRAANEVLRIDPESMSQLSAQQRTKVAVYATWVAENARDGKLPGFSSEEGKQKAAQLVERAVALIGKMDDGSKVQPDIQKNLDKADRLISAKAELQNSTSQSSQQSREESSRGAISTNAATAIAKDLVHAVYRSAEVPEAHVKYLLKSAGNLTPAATSDMEPQLRAQTAVAMSHLAQEVKAGAMGEFSKLPNQVQKNVVTAVNTAENLLTSMAKDPAMRAELNQAYSDLHAKTAGTSNTAGASSSKTASMEPSSGDAKGSSSGAKSESVSADKPATPAPTKQDGRSLDR